MLSTIEATQMVKTLKIMFSTTEATKMS